jgi:Large eukaryotic DNA virus major capsid protein.
MASSGCLVQLAAVGNANTFLDIDPQVTFFKQMWKRHSRFAIGELDEHFHSPGFNKKMTMDFPRAGDLLHKIYARYKLSALTINLDTPLQSEDGTNVTAANAVVHWANGIGNVLTKECEVQIGSQSVDKLYSEYLQIWEEHASSEGLKQGENIGYFDSVDDLRAFAARDRELYVYLPFFFATYPELSLPLIALQFHTTRFTLITRSREECIIAYVPGGANDGGDWDIPIARIEGGELQDCMLTSSLIYLDTMEREIFASEAHEYLFTGVQLQPPESVVAGTTQKTINLSFNHPVIELFWVYQENRNAAAPVNEWFNWGIEDPDGKYPWNNAANVPTPLIDPFKSVRLLLNSHERVSERNGAYFRTVQPKQYHSCKPERFIYSYSFGFRPEDHVPTGSCNMSRIDHVQLILKFNTLANDGEVRVYARYFNVMKIHGGMAAIRHAS